MMGPAPTRDPWVGNYTIRQFGEGVCMRLSFGAQIRIVYHVDDHIKYRLEDDETFTIDPNVATVDGNCDSPSKRTVVIYPFGSREEPYWTITLIFQLQSGTFALTEVDATYVFDEEHFPESDTTGYQSEGSESSNFLWQKVPTGKYYSCSDMSVELVLATVYLWDMQLQPFADDVDGHLGEADVCVPGLDLSAILGIVFGAVVVLVLVVVAVYCFRTWRRRKDYVNIQEE
ncbi:lysosome-associated membrane glycoprotein 3-like [Patiria miniata]|uniref:Lysosome-associated membrane glycoprotein 5 n=1 Tax=Patiria miniata TaxID=46514 RepID=A0A913ZHB8_PATMI|nr:lysosome-associated membrane glycoprotein 3-like [Patiria miniata]